MVAGDALANEWVSKMKLTLSANCTRQPEGKVSNRLSSRTEFKASAQSGSTSPSQMIHPKFSKIKVKVKGCIFGLK